jgi:hypothetical protein
MCWLLQVNLKFAMRVARKDFLHSTLFHALNGESVLRNLRFKYLEEVCSAAGRSTEELEDLSMTPVVGEAELLQSADFSLAGYVEEARGALEQALRDVRKLGVDMAYLTEHTEQSVAAAQ